MKQVCGNIWVDKEGVWHCDGRELIRSDIVETLLDHLLIMEDGRYAISFGESVQEVDVADTPFVITRVDRTRRKDTGEEEILLSLRHLSSVEVLDPGTLYVGAENVLYCRVRRGRFPGRFSRPAYYQFADWVEVEERTGEFFITLNGRRFPLRMETREYGEHTDH